MAQLPMSPVYRTGPEQPQTAADNAAPAAKDRAPAPRASPQGENASRAKPEAAEQEPVATAPIPPPLPSDANKPGANRASTTAEPGSHPAATPAEKTPRGRSGPDGHDSDADPVRSGPAERDRADAVLRDGKHGKTAPGIRARSSAACGPVSRGAQGERERPDAVPRDKTEGGSCTRSSANTATGSASWRAAAAPQDRPGKAATRAARRHAEARPHAQARRQVRRRDPAYYYWPPAYYARAPYPGAPRGYGGGAYGPSPYSSEGP